MGIEWLLMGLKTVSDIAIQHLEITSLNQDRLGRLI